MSCECCQAVCLLKKRTCFEIDSVEKCLHEEIFGDYLQNCRLRPVTKLKDVVSSVRAYQRFKTHEGSQHARLFKTFCENESEFDAYYVFFKRFCNLRDMVICEEWSRISMFLTKYEVCVFRKLCSTFAISRSSRFVAVKKAFDVAIASQCFSENDVLENSQLRWRVRSVFHDRFDERVNFVECFQRLFHKVSTRPERERLLKTTLSEHGLLFRHDSLFCRNFIDGDTDASVNEVVATMKICNYLFQRGGHRCYSANIDMMTRRMRHDVSEGLFANWYDACAAVLTVELKSWSYDDDDDDYDF